MRHDVTGAGVAATALPTFFIPHGGGPCFFMDWSPPETWTALGDFLRGLSQTFVRPKAVLVISGHWEATRFTMGTGEWPALIYDYHGFPEHTYRLQYPAAGSPMLAARIGTLLDEAGIAHDADSERGFDHGVFVPFKLIYPQADIPIVQLSLRRGLDPQMHLALGRALAPLRNEGVLIVGSGMSYHNLRGWGPSYAPASKNFDTWLTSALEKTGAERDILLAHWREAPAALMAHPREEHLLPLMVIAGAAADQPGQKVFEGAVPDVTVSAFRFG